MSQAISQEILDNFCQIYDLYNKITKNVFFYPKLSKLSQLSNNIFKQI